MTNKYPVSIVVPVFNAENFIERCAESLFCQTLNNVEFIFVDDCTPDSSISVLEKVIARHPDLKEAIQVIHNAENLKQSGSRRVGLQAATGEYILYVDADDWIEPEMAEQLYLAAKKNRADMVACELILEQKNGRIPLHYPEHIIQENSDFSKETLEEHYALFSSLWTKLIRRELLLKNEIILDRNITQFEDTAVVFFLRTTGKNFTRIHGTYYHYELRNEKSISRTMTFEKIMERVSAVEKCKDFLSNHQLTERYQNTLRLLEFTSKMDLVLLPETFRPADWRRIFPESSDLYRTYPNLSRFTRVLFAVVYHRLDWCAKMLCKLRRELKK